MWVTRHLVDDGSRYFGPYTDVGAMRRALNVVKRIFTVRSCNYDMPQQMPERPCLDYYIKRCKAPCILAQTQAEYRAMIDEVLVFLDGRTREVVRRVRERMDAGGRVARLRARGRAARRAAASRADGGADGRAVDRGRRPRRDRLRARRRRRRRRADAHSRRASCWRASTSSSRISRRRPTPRCSRRISAGKYLPLEDRAAELLVPFDPTERELVEASLERTKIHVPQRGPRRELVDLATQNARHLLEELRLTGDETDERAGDPVYELQRQLGLQKVPRSLVCFDISHAQGTDTVASCVWFQNGRPYRAEYRKFKVKTVEGIDDFASMNEVVTRYFTRRVDEEKPLPDLVVIDGGKGQLNAAHAALDALGLGAMPLISLAKREEEIFVLGRSESLRLPRRSPALRVLQQARDEAHRFAITFQRKRRAMRTVTSELLRIPGVGESKRRQLLAAFGSLQGVREAPPEAIAALPGFGRKRRSESSTRCATIRRSPRRPCRPNADVGADRHRTRCT